MEAVIKSWLNGARSYAVGIKLYGLYGTNESYKKVLVLPETAFRKEQLVAAMEEALTPAEPPAPDMEDTTGDDAIIAELKAKAIPLLKERNSLHGKLRLIRTVAERGQAAHKILDLDDAIDGIYDAIRYYQEHKELPEEALPFTPITDPAKWEHRYQTCGRYVRRYTKELKENPESETAQKLKDVYEAEQIWLAKKLNKWH